MGKSQLRLICWRVHSLFWTSWDEQGAEWHGDSSPSAAGSDGGSVFASAYQASPFCLKNPVSVSREFQLCPCKPITSRTAIISLLCVPPLSFCTATFCWSVHCRRPLVVALGEVLRRVLRCPLKNWKSHLHAYTELNALLSRDHMWSLRKPQTFIVNMCICTCPSRAFSM